MTTARSPLRILRTQAHEIAARLKRIADGHNDTPDPLGKLDAARTRDSITFGVVMDDKLLQIEMQWAVIRETSAAGIAEFILNQMRETRDAKH
jgi:hypothetical protein